MNDSPENVSYGVYVISHDALLALASICCFSDMMPTNNRNATMEYTVWALIDLLIFPLRRNVISWLQLFHIMTDNSS